jgi:hypothetical protein
MAYQGAKITGLEPGIDQRSPAVWPGSIRPSLTRFNLQKLQITSRLSNRSYREIPSPPLPDPI